MVTTQHMVNGHDESNRCNDSAVAQQLTAAKAKKANAQKTFKNLFSFIIEKFVPLATTAEILAQSKFSGDRHKYGQDGIRKIFHPQCLLEKL